MPQKKYASPGHREDTVTVSVWLKQTTLAKWNVFCEKHGNKTRASLIKDAVDEYIIAREMGEIATIQATAAKAEQREVIEKLEAIQKQVSEINKGDPIAQDPGMERRVLDFLGEIKSGITDAKLAKLMIVDRGILLDVLQRLKKAGEVKARYNSNHEGEWYVEH